MSMQSESAERRRDVRAQASPPTRIVRIGGGERVEVLNTSYRGLFLRTSGTPPRLNELIKLRIELPSVVVEMHAIPVRIVVDARGRSGVGIRFFALNGEEKRLWDAYITALLGPKRLAA